MTRNEIIKEQISKELAAFLLSDKHEPQKILLSVYYPESMARIEIDINKIKERVGEENTFVARMEGEQG